MDDPFVVYVLYSIKWNKIYIGYTQNLVARFYAHNELAHKGWTRRFRPWKVMHCEYFTTKKEAMNREKQLKSAQGRLWIRKNINSWNW